MRRINLATLAIGNKKIQWDALLKAKRTIEDEMLRKECGIEMLINEEFKEFSKKEARIFINAYFGRMTYDETSKKYKITKKQVRQIEKRIMEATKI